MSSVAKYVNKRRKKRILRPNIKRRKLTIRAPPEVSLENDGVDFVGRLPPEIVQNILSYLNPSDLRNALVSCKKWKHLVSDNYFWKHKCTMDNYLEMTESTRSKAYDMFVGKLPKHWERVYMYNEALHQNWKNQQYKTTIFDFPRGDPLVHYMDDEILVMTNGSKRIFVYNYYEERFLQVFTIQTNENHNHIIRKTLNFVVFASITDRLLTVWCIKTGRCQLNMIVQEESMVRGLKIHEHLIAVIFYAGSCQIVNILTGEVDYRCSHEVLTYSVCFYEDHVAFGGDSVINILNWSTKEITTTLTLGKLVLAHGILVRGDHLVSFTGKEIGIWSLKRKVKLHEIVQENKLKDSQTATFLNDRTILIKNCDQGALQAWDCVDGVLKFAIVLELDLLDGSVAMNDHYIFTFCTTTWKNSARMKIWHKDTGKLLSNVRLDKRFSTLLVTNTKYALLSTGYFGAFYIYDFEKKIKLKQLCAINA